MDSPQLFYLAFGVAFALSGLILLAMRFFQSWRRNSDREYDLQIKRMEIEQKIKEEELHQRNIDRYENEERQKREEEIELSKIAGAGTGGYIILDLPENQRTFFHDLLKGFEDYAKLKGYSISFSIDATLSNRIAFKFTFKDNFVNVGQEKVRADFKEYMNRVRSGESFDDLPVIISFEEHELLVTVLKNRVNFLQHSYNLEKNTVLCYENLINNKFGSMPLLPAPTVVVQTGGNMYSRKYEANNSSRLIQGGGNEYHDSSIDSSITIGNSFNEKKSQIEGLTKLVNAIRGIPDIEAQNKEAVIKDLEKVKDELQDEEQPDKSRIKKWLERAKSLLDFAKKGKEIFDLAKQVYESFGFHL